MIDLAYIQKSRLTGEFTDDSGYQFWHGCHKLGIPTQSFEDVARCPLTKGTLVHGGVQTVQWAFAKLGVPKPQVPTAPPELKPWYGRKMWTTSIKWFRRGVQPPQFIKPLHEQKLFTGYVTHGDTRDLVELATYDDDVELLCSEPVNFVSEHRLFIHRDTIIGCRHYLGDLTKYPDFDVALACVEAFKSAPCAYSLDLGVTEDGRTLVVEVNDAYALGAYGLSSMQYAFMVVDRWGEIVK